MSILYCGKSNNYPYYVKEADLNIRSIYELAYFIYNYSNIISNNFISKNLIIYIDKTLNMPELAKELNTLYTKKASLPDMLTLILKMSDYYTPEEIEAFKNKLIRLLDYPEKDYISIAGDKLFFLGKYERAITQYAKISKVSEQAMLKLAYSYAKLQFYAKAAEILGELYKITNDEQVLRETYYALKLSGNVDDIYNYEPNVSEEKLADWEFDVVSEIIKVRKSDELKQVEDLFLMGSSHIKSRVSDLIKIWKEKYRYIG